MKNHYLFASCLLALIATAASAQVEISDVNGPFFREFERRQVTIFPGGIEQIGVSCEGGHILSAGAVSFQDGEPDHDRLDLSNIHITTVSSAYIDAVNRGDKEFQGVVLAYALCWKL